VCSDICYRDGAGITLEENSGIFFKFASCHQQGHVGSKTLLQQNPPFLTGGVPANAGFPV